MPGTLSGKGIVSNIQFKYDSHWSLVVQHFKSRIGDILCAMELNGVSLKSTNHFDSINAFLSSICFSVPPTFCPKEFFLPLQHRRVDKSTSSLLSFFSSTDGAEYKYDGAEFTNNGSWEIDR